jgi:curved DNA-binding protein CbpA
VKRYHPDRQSPEASHEQIALVNQAYDLLSDPERRAQYDGFAQIFVEVKEDPVEVYKREFKRKRREREKQEREAELARKQNIYDVMRRAQHPHR